VREEKNNEEKCASEWSTNKTVGTCVPFPF
jgi:hypothetical protein